VILLEVPQAVALFRALPRPAPQIGAPKVEVYDDDDYLQFAGGTEDDWISDDEADELALIMDELDDFSESMARSSDSGWFYSD